MFQSQVQFPVTLTVATDPADGETYQMWVAPAACEVVSAYAAIGATITAGPGTGLSLILQNGGTAGTGTTAIGTIGNGTAETWTADTLKAATLGVAALAAGEALCVKYDETDNLAVGWINVSVGVRFGTS